MVDHFELSSTVLTGDTKNKSSCYETLANFQLELENPRGTRLFFKRRSNNSPYPIVAISYNTDVFFRRSNQSRPKWKCMKSDARPERETEWGGS